jgi:hypothetical protein
MPPIDPIQDRPRFHGSIQVNHGLFMSGRVVPKRWQKICYRGRPHGYVALSLHFGMLTRYYQIFVLPDNQPEPQNTVCANLCSKHHTPKSTHPRSTDESLFKFRPFRYYLRIWKNGITAFRDEIALRWETPKLPLPYPFQLPGPDDLAEHAPEFNLLRGFA